MNVMVEETSSIPTLLLWFLPERYHPLMTWKSTSVSVRKKVNMTIIPQRIIVVVHLVRLQSEHIAYQRAFEERHRSVGAPVRVLKNRMSREYVRQENAGADKMELEKYTLGSLRRAVFEGDTTTGSLMAGQVAGMLHEVRPVADILADLWNSGRQRIAALSTEC